jgi:hypothetical protein
MADLDRLQTLTADIQPPQFDDLVETARRRDRRRNSAALVVAAIVAVGITLGGIRGLGDDRPAPAPAPDRSQPPRLEDIVGGDILPAGVYSLGFAGDLDQNPRAYVTIPDGYRTGPGEGGEAAFVWTGTEGRVAALEFTTAERVPKDPCNARPDKFVTPGPGVRPLADALAAQRNALVTEPVRVRVDGHRGLYLETSMPRSVDPAGCYGGVYTSWTSTGGAVTTVLGGLTTRVWILDVDGERLVVGLVWTPDADATDVAELDAMVDSLELRHEPAGD